MCSNNDTLLFLLLITLVLKCAGNVMVIQSNEPPHFIFKCGNHKHGI